MWKISWASTSTPSRKSCLRCSLLSAHPNTLLLFATVSRNVRKDISQAKVRLRSANKWCSLARCVTPSPLCTIFGKLTLGRGVVASNQSSRLSRAYLVASSDLHFRRHINATPSSSRSGSHSNSTSRYVGCLLLITIYQHIITFDTA